MHEVQEKIIIEYCIHEIDYIIKRYGGDQNLRKKVALEILYSNDVYENPPPHSSECINNPYED